MQHPGERRAVAGGIVFLPVLTARGMCARDAVAFSSFAQAFGVGVFTPLNWCLRDDAVLLHDVLLATLPAAAVGAALVLHAPMATGRDEEHVEHVVRLAFSGFCAFTFVCVLHTLAAARVDAPLRRFSPVKPIDAAAYAPACALAGAMTALVGVGLDKLVFLLAILRHDARTHRATVTGVAAVGWVSAMLAWMHAHSPCRGDRGYVGTIPYAEASLALPGLLLGSMLGPALHARLGSRAVLIAFLLFLAHEAVDGAFRVARTWTSPHEACRSAC